MDIDPPPDRVLLNGGGGQHDHSSTQVSNMDSSAQGKARIVGPSRTLRVRPSFPPIPPVQTSAPGRDAAHIRPATRKELDNIQRRLGPESIAERREELLKGKEQELRDVIDGHDLNVREKFHLERYVTLVEGWDPELAKQDNPPVFLDYKRFNHNLLHMTPVALVNGNAEAGPSKHARNPLPTRTTRRQAHEQSDAFAMHASVASELISTPSSAKKGKGRAEGETSAPLARSRGNETQAKEEVSVVPVKGSSKAKRRATLDSPATPSSDADSAPSDVPTKGKKKGRASMPASALSRTTQIVTLEEQEAEESASPAVEVSATSPEPSRAPTPLPSLADVPFPPPPIRPKRKYPGPHRRWYTIEEQLPANQPNHGGDLSSILNSYIHIEDTGPQIDEAALDLRAAREAYYRNRVNYLNHQGRLLRLIYDDDDALSTKASKSHHKAAAAPSRQTDYHDSLMAHMVQVRNAMLNEAKFKPQHCRRIAKMIQAYWEHLENREERERQAEERELKRKMRDLMRGLRKRWSLAVKIVRARLLEEQKVEQDRLGKEHLQDMLKRSTGMLRGQKDAMEGLSDEDDEDSTDDEGDLDMSDEEDSEEEGTDAVSAAEDDDDLNGTDAVDTDADVTELVNGAEQGDDSAAQSEAAAELSEGDSGADPEEDEDDEDDEGSEGDVGPGLEALLTESHADSDVLAPQPREMPQATLAVPHLERQYDASSPDPLDFLDENGQDVSSPAVATPAEGPPTRRSRSRRARSSASAPIDLKTEDPDANDEEFAAIGSDLDEQDHDLDVKMEEEEDEEGNEADSEDEGLLADADVPIEELLKRYGYPTPDTEGHPAEPLSDQISPNVTVDALGNGIAIETDKSLVDEAFPAQPISPVLVVDGKRQRRVRSVWTPEDNPPHPVKRPKIEILTPSPSPTPSMTSEESEMDEEEGADAEQEKPEAAEPEDPNRVRPPFLLRGTLRPYQQGGLEWLASLYANKMNGILADEMGLGKTIQTIALLGHLACDKGVWGQHLIIVPTSVILNWEMEFKKFLPGLKVLTYYGNQKERKDKRVGWHTENAWQVCITSYQIVLADQHIFRRKNWVYMILDEAHNIKNFRSQRWQTLLGFKAQRRLLLTGTPLQNNLMELWSLLYFLMPGGVTEDATSVVGFANHKEFMEWFSNPMDQAVESGETLDMETIETVKKLHTLLRPFILRRLKSEVETQLPGKFEHVVYCRLSKRQRFLYDEFMARASTREALTSGGYLGVVNTLMQLRKVCNHPDLFEVRPVRTSFAMEKSVLAEFEPSDVLVRKRLLTRQDDLALQALNLNVSGHEHESSWACRSRSALDASDKLPFALDPGPVKKGREPGPPELDTRTVEGWLKYRAYIEQEASKRRWHSLRDINRLRCRARPMWGSTFLNMLTSMPRWLLPADAHTRSRDLVGDHSAPASGLIRSLTERAKRFEPVVEQFAVIPPNATTRDLPMYALPGISPDLAPDLLDPDIDTLHHAATKLQIAFPDASLLQYDCGKLQKLYEMLRDLKSNGHRVLIFTQMTRVLDILEMFLSFNGHRYLRLDGSTKIEDRQIITERFNSDSRIFCFIASSRSGGVGINLTGADTVFFYDSDWNPSMDRQCMDRAHRIGQTREVHIYRFVSSHTVEENMLKKANQKRLLDKVVIQEGDFTTEFFGKMDWRDMLDETMPGAERPDEKEGVEDVAVEDEPMAVDAEETAPRAGEERNFADALAQVEDEEDAAAARVAQGEGEMDLNEFADTRTGKPIPQTEQDGAAKPSAQEGSATPGPRLAEDDEEAEEEDDDVGAVDEYMLKWVEEDWEFFVSFGPVR